MLVKSLSLFGEISLFSVQRCKGIIAFVEHLRENFRRLLLFWWFFGTFAGVFSPENVAVLVVFWNICGKISGVCCCFGGFLEHLRENLRRLRDDMPSRKRSARESNSERKLA